MEADVTVDPRSPVDLDLIRRRMAEADSAVQRDRYRVVLLALEGYDGPELTRAQIVRTVGRSRQFVDEWTRRYRDGGIDALVAGKSTGRPPALDDEELRRFKQRITSGPTDADGGVCTLRGPEARRILEEEFGKPLTLTSAYNLMHRVGLSCLKPRPRHRKSDPVTQQQWLERAPFLSTKSSSSSSASDASRSGSRTRPALASKAH
jgi:transposase